MELGRLRDSYDKEKSWLDEMEDDHQLEALDYIVSYICKVRFAPIYKVLKGIISSRCAFCGK